MEVIDGQERWYRISLTPGRYITTGTELTAANHPPEGGRVALIRLRFLHATGPHRDRELVCEDADGTRHLVAPSAVRTVHRKRELPARGVVPGHQVEQDQQG